MILITGLKSYTHPKDTDLVYTVEKALKVEKSEIISVKLYRVSVDARRKFDVHYSFSVAASLRGNKEKTALKNKNVSVLSAPLTVFKKAATLPEHRPIVVGFGPAGMFAALTLARAGMKPIILERGYDVDTRKRNVEEYFKSGKLNAESNVQFGEGGAGTFSDGKLATGIKDGLVRTVIEEFYSHGAHENVLYDAKPHIGTDILSEVVKNIRKEITSLKGEIIFGATLSSIEHDKDVKSITYTKDGKTFELPCDALFLGIGHSARDTFSLLKSEGINLIRKPFSVGVRIEHKQEMINRSQYGECDNFPAADYKLATHLENARSVYTFCMCPGGYVINAASEKDSYVTNGMSNSARDGDNANSALLVNINPEDIEGTDVLGGMEFQRKIEQSAFLLTNGEGVPAITVGDFLNDSCPTGFKNVTPTVKPKAMNIKFDGIFPTFVTESLKRAIPVFGKKIKGFDSPDAVLTAPETRSSCPVRIVRDESMQSSVLGIYPIGEGSGYAGGITSSAVDGIKAALKFISKYE